MKYKTGIPRDQLVLIPESIDDMISDNNPVRVIDAWVESLDLRELGFMHYQMKTGAPPYKNELLMKIYIYGYMNRIRSGRKLERECKLNREMIWLTSGLAPDFKTITDFRKKNKKGIRNLFREFLKFCTGKGLISLETVAIDGTKMRAQNSTNQVFKKEEIEKVKARIEAKITEYLTALDMEDEKETEQLKLNEGGDVSEIVRKLKEMSRYKDQVDEMQKAFKEDETLKMIFATDPEARFQSDKGKVNPGYNAQTIVDEKNKLIVATDVTNRSNDLKEMTPMIEKLREVKEDMGIEEETNAVMDAGYFSETEIIKNKEIESINIVVPDTRTSKEKKVAEGKIENKQVVPASGYEISDFRYDEEKDRFICPEGNDVIRITLEPFQEPSGRKTIEYHCYDCDGCIKRLLCTNNQRGRSITVSTNKEAMDRFKVDMKSEQNKKLISKRKEIAEHPFGTLKRNLGYTYFLQKGLENVKTEFSFMCFAYNFKRLLNLFTVSELLEALK